MLFSRRKKRKDSGKKYADNIISTKPGLNLKPGFTGVTQNKMVVLGEKKKNHETALLLF